MHPETLKLFLSSWQVENLSLIPGYKMQPQQRRLLTMKFETDCEGKETNKTYTCSGINKMVLFITTKSSKVNNQYS